MDNKVTGVSWVGIFNNFTIHLVTLNIYLRLLYFLRCTVHFSHCIWRRYKLFLYFLFAHEIAYITHWEVLFEFKRHGFLFRSFKSWSLSYYGVLKRVQFFEINLILVEEVLKALLFLKHTYIRVNASLQSDINSHSPRPFDTGNFWNLLQFELRFCLLYSFQTLIFSLAITRNFKADL
jgi:hypothetical protein